MRHPPSLHGKRILIQREVGDRRGEHPRGDPQVGRTDRIWHQGIGTNRTDTLEVERIAHTRFRDSVFAAQFHDGPAVDLPVGSVQKRRIPRRVRHAKFGVVEDQGIGSGRGVWLDPDPGKVGL